MPLPTSSTPRGDGGPAGGARDAGRPEVARGAQLRASTAKRAPAVNRLWPSDVVFSDVADALLPSTLFMGAVTAVFTPSTSG